MFDATPLLQCSATAPCAQCPRADGCMGRLLGNAVCHTAPGFGRSEHLFHAGDPVEFLYVIRRGAVKAYQVSADGQEQILGFHASGDIVGLDAMAGREFEGNAVAIEQTEVCRLPADAVRRRLAESEPFRQAFFGSMGREIQRLHRLLHLDRCTAEQRVASFLLSRLHKVVQNGAVTRIELPMSRAEIGCFLDLATETVSRMFTRLQEHRVFRTVAGGVEVLDLDALVRVARTGLSRAEAMAEAIAPPRPRAALRGLETCGLRAAA